MAIEQSAIMLKKLNNNCTAKEDFEFISSLDINYLNPAKGNLLFSFSNDENSGEVLKEKTGVICCQYRLNWRIMNK
jgi:hypothetical protein